ncbi:MAG TPA: 50S ribosomal protein L10 [Candidatus Saccharimonadales bacterium]|nr:50S ribosomal protein L10 [Candidatus Saccharimonadales bacterium]
MALTKQEKDEVIEEVKDLLSTSKMTVVATYQGTTVKALQRLRRDVRESGTNVKVVKNRLFIKAMQQLDNLKDVDTSSLEGMLLYAFNSEDEVAPAQSLNAFAKSNPTIKFIGAISADGNLLGAEEVKALAGLPGKNQLIAEVVATLLSPVNDVTNALSGNLHALLDGIAAKAA